MALNFFLRSGLRIILTRILTIYKDNLHAALAVPLLLGEEEEALGTTLDTVHVVVDVEERHGEGEARDDDTVHLAGGVGVERDGRDEDNLNDGQLGERGHGEALLDSVDFLSGLGGGVHGTFTVNWHFYYLPRK